MKFAKKCLQFILKLQERLILSVQRGNAKFNIHSENTLFQIVKNKKEFSANTQPSCFSGWSQKIPRDERVGECETAAKCRSHSKSSSPPVSSSKSPERQTRNRQHRQKVTQPLIYEMSKPVSSNHSYYWEGLRSKITPRPKPYSDRTAIKFTSKVDFNLLGSPFRYLERSQNLGGHDSELIGGKQMIFPARFCGRNQQFPVFTCQNLDNLELN